ncbi:MAG: class I SAM-dependent methyltransferase [Candidatus Hodarchaeota archaeon]
MPNQIFDFLSPIYDYVIRGAPPDAIVGLLKLSSNCNERILEIGTGTGRTVQDLCRLCDSLWLMDPSVRMLRITQKKYPNATVVHGFVEKIPFSNDFFDRVLAVDSLHHWDNHIKGLSEVYRVLKPNGLFVLIDFDPNTRFGHYIRSLERLLNMGSTFFTPRQMRHIHRKVGLKILRQRYIDQGTYVTISKPITKI